MTSTASAKSKWQQGLTTFRWELRNCASPLLIYGILSAVLVTVTLTLCLVTGFGEAVDSTTLFDYGDILGAMRVFQLVATYGVFYLNAIFTIIYTIRIFSYLHNKRKADMYGALPISRRTFFAAKTISAALISIVPALALFGVTAVISMLFGQPLLEETVRAYVMLPLGSVASISFYALLAVCCGSTVNAVLCFVAVNIAYPIAALFIKGSLMTFLVGLPLSVYGDSFIMKALNPLSAYQGGNVIYWLLFTAACVALGILLVKRRRAECAQTTFAYYLPAYIVKLLVAFISGMFLGVIFGSLGVLVFPFLGFMFGFVLGSAPAYVITHMIFYRGVRKLGITCIALGGLVVTVAAAMFMLNTDILGYTSRVPAAEDVKSAGVIDLSDCYYAGKKGVAELALMAADDFDDAEGVGLVTSYHGSVVRYIEHNSIKSYANVMGNMLMSNFPFLERTGGVVVSYRLNSGLILTRYYPQNLSAFDYTSSPNDINKSALNEILGSEEYFLNYSSVMNASPDEIVRVQMEHPVTDGDETYYYRSYRYDAEISVEDDNSGQAKADIRRLMEAYRADYKRVGGSVKGSAVLTFDISCVYRQANAGSLFDDLFASISYDDNDSDRGYVYSNYTETLKVLRDLGVIDKDNNFIPGTDNSKY